MLTTSLLLGLLTAALLALAVASWFAPLRQPRRALSSADKDHTLMDSTMWPPGWPHNAPDRPMGTPEAHQTMQRHRNCRREECPRKNTAYTTLVAVGHIKPDVSRVS